MGFSMMTCFTLRPRPESYGNLSLRHDAAEAGGPGRQPAQEGCNHSA
jgi:hypothetical protein